MPVKALFDQNHLTWNAVYYPYRKWYVSDVLMDCWIRFLKAHKKNLDLSSADAGFDSKSFRDSCSKKDINANICFNKRNGNTDDRDEYFDHELYNERYAVKRTNAWMDSFRSLLNRFDTTVESWKGFNYVAFFVIALKKTKKRKIIKV